MAAAEFEVDCKAILRDRIAFLKRIGDKGRGVLLTRPTWASNGHIAFERFIQFTPGETIQVFLTDEERSFEMNVIAETGYQNSRSDYK